MIKLLFKIQVGVLKSYFKYRILNKLACGMEGMMIYEVTMLLE